MLLPESQPVYLGCFLEDIYSPDLTGEPPLIITRAEACFTHCSIGTWSYAAIRNRTICTCGDTYNKHGPASASECSTACPQEQSAYDDCGGPKTNSIYSVGAIVPQVPFPTPSVHPVYPTPPIDPNDQSGAGDQLVKHSERMGTVVISCAVVAVAVMTIAAMSLAVYRRRKNRTSIDQGRQYDQHDRACMDDDKGATVGSRNWFPMGSKSRRMDREDDMQEGGQHRHLARAGSNTAKMHDRDIEANLFDGFESSAVNQDGQDHGPIHPLDHGVGSLQYPQAYNRPSEEQDSTDGMRTMTSSSRTLSNNAHNARSRRDSAHQGPSSVSDSSEVPSSLASKIGQKLSQLRVKTQFLQPHQKPTTGSSFSTKSGAPPISPISPISPASVTSSHSSPTQSGFSPSLSSVLKDGSCLESGSTYQDERSFGSATPSFSMGPSSGAEPVLRKQRSLGEPSDITSLTSTLERFPSHEIGVSTSTRDYFEPPSPISPSQHISLVPSSSQHHPHRQDPRYQKQHRSNLIKDLILQGDSALEDKEMALMAQYQPHHSRQQQQQRAMYPTTSDNIVHRRSSSSATDHSIQSTKVDPVSLPAVTPPSSQPPSSDVVVPSTVPVPVPMAAAPVASNSTTFTPASNLALFSSLSSSPEVLSSLSPSSPSSTKRRKNSIPAIDTNYLAPPPRILIHKAL